MSENRKPQLLIMAAGLGSRYGGLKQMDPVDEYGHLIIDYSMYDALKAGFGSIVCVIRRENEEMFEERIGRRVRRFISLEYAYQDMNALPAGYAVPEGRVKPWGTGHAVLCAKDKINAPLCVINADDFYGRGAFEKIAAFLSAPGGNYEYAMVGYRVENTVTPNGSVARGVCEQRDGYLTGIHERTRVEPREGGAAYTEDDGATWHFLPAGTPVSMNMWGFRPSVLDELENRFPAWLDEALKTNPLKAEYFLPLIPNMLLTENKATVRVLDTDEKWYGVTYREDRQDVCDALKAMRQSGRYPDKLWE